MKKNSKGFIHLLPLLIVALVLIVGVGYYAYKNGQIRLYAPQQQEPSPTPNPTTGWKTYINNKYNYKIKYPLDWTVKENNNISYDFVSFLPPDTNGIDPTGKIAVMAEKINTQITTDTDALGYFQSFMESCSSQTPIQCTQKNSDDYKLEKQVTVSSKLAFQTYGGCCMDFGRHVFLYNSRHSYRFTLYNLSPSTTNFKNEGIFNQILSTFQFLE